MISDAEEKYNIKILYLAANQDAILQAEQYGINASQALNYSENSDNVTSAYRSAASAAFRQRTTGAVAFTDFERSMSQTPNDDNVLTPTSNKNRIITNTNEPPPIRRR